MANMDPSLFSDSPAPSDDHLFTDEPAPQDEGALMAAGRGALRNFPLAQQAAAALSPGDYSKNIKDMTARAEAAKAAHPIAYGTGAVAGTAAPLLIPGVGEVLEGAPILGNAALGAIQSQSDTNFAHPTGADAMNAGVGAAIGGGLGALGAKFLPKPVAAPVAQAAEAAPVAEAAPIAQAAKPVLKNPPSLGGLAIPENKIAADFVPSADRVYAHNIAQGMGGTPRQLMKVLGKNDPVKSLVSIGKWMETAGPEGKSLVGLMDRPGELLDKVNAVHDTAGHQIGEIIKSMGESTDIDTAQLIEEMQDFADRTADPETEARIAKLIKVTENNLKKGVGDFDNLQQIKGMAGKQIAKDPEMSEVYGHLADKLESLVDAHGAAIKDPSLAQAYAKARTDYANSSRILPMLRYAEAKNLVGGPAGHHTLRGLLGSIFDMAATMTGAPPVAQFERNIALKTAPVARNIANAGASARAASGGKLGQAATAELMNALESKFGQRKPGNDDRRRDGKVRD